MAKLGRALLQSKDAPMPRVRSTRVIPDPTKRISLLSPPFARVRSAANRAFERRFAPLVTLFGFAKT
jgi:hypothetical protein